MTSFQRMVLVAAVLFMITAHVTDAMAYYCYPHRNCEGNPEIIVSYFRTNLYVSMVMYIHVHVHVYNVFL